DRGISRTGCGSRRGHTGRHARGTNRVLPNGRRVYAGNGRHTGRDAGCESHRKQAPGANRDDLRSASGSARSSRGSRACAPMPNGGYLVNSSAHRGRAGVILAAGVSVALITVAGTAVAAVAGSGSLSESGAAMLSTSLGTAIGALATYLGGNRATDELPDELPDDRPAGQRREDETQ